MRGTRSNTAMQRTLVALRPSTPPRTVACLHPTQVQLQASTGLRHRRRAEALPGRVRPTAHPFHPSHRTLGLTHLRFEAMLTAARQSANPFDFALVCLLGLLGLRIFETVGADIDDLGEEHRHRVLRICGKGGRVVLVPLPPAVSRAVDRAGGDRTAGPPAPEQPRRSDGPARRHPAATSPRTDAGVDLRDVQIAARHADPRTTRSVEAPSRRRQSAHRGRDRVPVALRNATAGNPR